MNIDEAQLDAIADALVVQGYIITDKYLPSALLTALLQHFKHLPQGEFKAAGIGRNTDFMVQENIRSDNICWLDTHSPATSAFLACMDALRAGLNRRLFLGLNEYESHFAHYPVGAFYKKHRDAFAGKVLQGQSNRVLSTVLYLNENWPIEAGGELIMYAEDGEQALEKISPEFGRLVIFLSEKFPHEVLPATCERNSIAGWFRANH